ncbi:MAG: tetratricopeptide repeat protein, partial [Syntrophothermus sp.]
MNKTHFLLLALFFFTAIATAQIKKAENLMMLFNYSEAGKILQKVVEENDPETMDKASLLLAECYRKQNAYLPAGAWYARVIASGNATPETYFYYGQMLRATGDYDRAKNIFLKYDSVSGNSNGKLFASYCDSAIRWKSARPVYTVTNAAALNSGVADFSPVFYEKGIVFTSDRNVPEKKGGTYGWTGNSYLHLMAAGPAGDTAFDAF